MPYVATKQPYMLMIIYDEDAQNPREDSEPFGTMACWHNRYNLGDGNDGASRESFMEDLVLESMSNESIIKEARRGYYVKMEYDRADKGYLISNRENLRQSFRGYEFVEGKFENIKDDLAVTIVQAMSMEATIELAERNSVILPLYLYDHSGITMSTAPFSCKWDSGQVGWIYASREDIEKEYGSVTPETIEKATNLLISEVKTYDDYLRGENYGFKLFKDGEETDSCWGFLGDIDDVKNVIAEHLPDDCKDIVSDLDYIDDSDTRQYEQGYEDDFEEMEAI